MSCAKNGNYLRIQVVVGKVLKDETQKDPQGNPIYQVNTSTAVSLYTPEEMRDMEE